VDDGGISVRRISDDQELLRITETDPRNKPTPVHCSLRFSPDGRLLATQGTQQIPAQVWELGAGKLLWKARVDGRYWNDLGFSPDSRQIALPGPDGSVMTYDAASGKELQRFGSGSAALCIRFHPQESKLAVSRAHDLQIIDLESGAVVRSIKTDPDIGGFEWSQNGHLLVVSSGREVLVYDARTGKQQATCKGHHESVIHVTFNHAGNLIASTSWDRTTRLWDPHTGRQLLLANGFGASFSRDDRWLSFGTFGSVVGRWQVAAASEAPVLPGQNPKWGVRTLAISSDNRLLVSTSCYDVAGDGVRLWDLATGELRHVLSTGQYACRAAILHPSGRSLVTCSQIGVHRWPLQWDANNEARVSIGPPELLVDKVGHEPGAKLSHDGKSLLVLCPQKAVVLDWDHPRESRRELSHPEWHLVLGGISPDGRWAGTAAWHGQHLQLWNAQTGKPEKRFEAARVSPVFSPDGQWLVLARGDTCAFHRMGTWELSHRIARDDAGLGGGALQFSSDSSMLAMRYSPQLAKLVDPATGHEFASLLAPETDILSCLAFSPDGSLLAVGAANDQIRIWDLRRIRAQLAEMGLDWEAPPLEATSRASPVMPLRVEIVWGDLADRTKPTSGSPQDLVGEVASLTATIAANPQDATAYLRRARIYYELEELKQAIEDYNVVIQLDPENVKAYHQLAWIYAMAPPEFRDAEKGVEVARKAVALRPDYPASLRNLGLAYYRAGRFQESVEALRQAIALHRGGSPLYYLLPLATALHRIGQFEEAKASYDEALAQWKETRQPSALMVREVEAMRKEAAEALDIQEEEK
jgi:WD40 repeat protein/Tfp pilus assembly protein PilF